VKPKVALKRRPKWDDAVEKVVGRSHRYSDEAYEAVFPCHVACCVSVVDDARNERYRY